METGFSVIICTHNPELIIFGKLLKSLNEFIFDNSFSVEFILVDNNSNRPIEEYTIVGDFIKSKRNVQLISEKKPGLTSARIAGFKKAKYDWVVFFDDDNEPAADYLTEAVKIINRYPHAGVWGPGKIDVEFNGKVSKFALGQKELFQQRSMSETIIDNVRWEQNAYPFGTGMIVRKGILFEYNKNVLEGKYSLTDRIGNSLISGGDIQILLTAIKMGYYAGSSPCLKLVHNIDVNKTKYKRIIKLAYSLSASAIKSYNEVFSDQPFAIQKIDNLNVCKTIYYELRIGLFKKGIKQLVFDIYKRLGELEAHIIASPNNKPPVLLTLFSKIIT